MENISDFIEFRIDKDKELLYGKWLRDVSDTEYKDGLKQISQLINKFEIKLWLQNSEQLQPRSIADQRWLTEEFGLLLVQSSVKYIAVVTTKDSAHYSELQALREKGYRIFGKATQIEVFETEEEALAWMIPNMQYYRLPAATYTINTNLTS